MPNCNECFFLVTDYATSPLTDLIFNISSIHLLPWTGTSLSHATEMARQVLCVHTRPRVRRRSRKHPPACYIGHSERRQVFLMTRNVLRNCRLHCKETQGSK